MLLMNAKGAVNKLVSEKLDKIIDGAKTASDAIGTEGSELLGNVASGNTGGTEATNVADLVKGIKSIVEIVLKEGKPDAGDAKKADALQARTATTPGNGEAGKLFVNTGISGVNPKKVAADAAKAVGAVTGADILQAMVKDDGDAAKLATNNHSSNDGSTSAPKDATIAGGIALRAMAKGGKFASGSDLDGNKATADSAVSSVNKVLNTLTIAIRKAIDAGLKEVKEAMKINPETTPVISEAGNVTK